MADKHNKNGHGGKGHGDGKGDGGKGHKGGGKGSDPSTVKSLIRDLLGSKTTQPLSGKSLKKYLNAGAKIRYNPLENQLDAQLRAEKATQHRNKAYYNDYLSRVRAIQGQTGDIYNNANQQLAQAQQQASVGDTNLLQILNQNRQGQAALMGASPSSAANPLAQAQVNRATDAMNNQARVIGQGATQQSYFADQRRIGAAQKIQTMFEGQDRQRALRQQLQDLAREKGAFKTDMMRDLREGERGFLVDLLSGPNARKLAHIQGSEARKTDNNAARHSSSSSSSSSSDHEKANKGKNRRANQKSARDAMTELRSLSGKDKRSDVGELTRYLVDQGYDPSLARRIARRFSRHGGGGGGRRHGGGHKPNKPPNHPGVGPGI